MREVTITKKVFKFDELSDKAKRAVINEHYQAMGYPWSREAKESLWELAKHFGGKVGDWSINWDSSGPSWITFQMPEDMAAHEIAAKILELGSFNLKTLKGDGDCKLTGYVSDENAIDGLRIAFRGGEWNLDRLMQAAFKSWLKACHDDFADMQTFEQHSETCEANEYEFLEDGSLFVE